MPAGRPPGAAPARSPSRWPAPATSSAWPRARSRAATPRRAPPTTSSTAARSSSSPTRRCPGDTRPARSRQPGRGRSTPGWSWWWAPRATSSPSPLTRSASRRTCSNCIQSGRRPPPLGGRTSRSTVPGIASAGCLADGRCPRAPTTWRSWCRPIAPMARPAGQAPGRPWCRCTTTGASAPPFRPAASRNWPPP